MVDGVEVAVRRSARARRVRLVAKAGTGVELVLPPSGGEQLGRELVDAQRDWIRRQAARLDRRELGLERAGVVWRHGEPLALDVRHAPRGRTLASDDRVVVAAPGPDAAARLVERWYRDEARRAAEAVIAGLPAPHPTALRIADGSSRWGSCSRSGRVSLSWRLLLAPREVLDYVVVHELCHLRHLDHGRRFWAAVEALRPGWRAQHEWLARHGAELHAYDPACAVGPLRVAA